MSGGGWPLPLRLYAALAGVALPLAWRRADRKLSEQGVAAARRRERLGFPTIARPAGRLIWVHAASVGESLSALPLVERLREGGTVLVTTGTGTSGAVMEKRLPEGAPHQFAALDAPGAVRRFLDHWRPDLAVFVESEIWPVTLREAARRGVPLALVNARLSRRSLERWARAPGSARALLGLFGRAWAQTDGVAAALGRLGARDVSVGGNMKAGAPPPPDAPEERERIAAALGKGPVWAAVSTHPGEERAALEAHWAVRIAHPDARLILVPRHPERGAEVERIVRERAFSLAVRSRGETPDAEVYLADTLGETGLWFRLAPVVFLGGSYVPVGGHNPWEPASCGAALLTGPMTETVRGDVEALEAAGAAETVLPQDLGARVAALLGDPATAAAMGAAGRRLYEAQGTRAGQIAGELLGMLR